MRSCHIFGSFLCVLALLLPAERATAQDTGTIAPEAREYLEHALRIMEARALTRSRVDWAEVRADAYRMAAGARHARETHRAISAALWALGDNHSRFVPPMSELPAELRRIMAEQAGPEPEARRVSNDIGYISIPGFSGPEPAAFARQILDRISDVGGEEVCGWIVDVRGNTGGNMWPMLEGLSPILGSGVPGYFVAPDGTWTPWSVGGERVAGVEPSGKRLAVAVLQGNRTASSGEAVVVAFRGRPAARSFGQSTGGLSTATVTLELSDGAKMILTVSEFADRDHNVYGEAIEPDELVADGTPEEQVIDRVAAWIRSQSACSDRGTESDVGMRAT